LKNKFRKKKRIGKPNLGIRSKKSTAKNSYLEKSIIWRLLNEKIYTNKNKAVK